MNPDRHQLALLAEQPAPTNETGDVWMELIGAEPDRRLRDMMLARRAQGIERYGRPLGRDNGRDHVADALQEALDGMVYAQAAGREDVVEDFREAVLTLTEAIQRRNTP